MRQKPIYQPRELSPVTFVDLNIYALFCNICFMIAINKRSMEMRKLIYDKEKIEDNIYIYIQLYS